MATVPLLLGEERFQIFLENAVDKRLFGIARPVRAGGVGSGGLALRVAQCYAAHRTGGAPAD
jgi:hypothetical protein